MTCPASSKAPAILGESASLYLPWNSGIALSHVEKHGTPIAGSHDTVDTIISGEWLRSSSIRSKVHTARENAVEIDVEAAPDADGKEEWSIQNRKFDHLFYFIDSFICILEQVTEVSYLSRTVSSTHKKTLERSICDNWFVTILGVFNVILCRDSAASKDFFLCCSGKKSFQRIAWTCLLSIAIIALRLFINQSCRDAVPSPKWGAPDVSGAQLEWWSDVYKRIYSLRSRLRQRGGGLAAGPAIRRHVEESDGVCE